MEQKSSSTLWPAHAYKINILLNGPMPDSESNGYILDPQTMPVLIWRVASECFRVINLNAKTKPETSWSLLWFKRNRKLLAVNPLDSVVMMTHIIISSSTSLFQKFPRTVSTLVGTHGCCCFEGVFYLMLSLCSISWVTSSRWRVGRCLRTVTREANLDS